MQSSGSVKTLEEILDETKVVLRAAENFNDNYRRDEVSFKKLVRNETKFVRSLKTYFNGLPDRIWKFVNWHEYQMQAIKAVDVVVDVTDNADWDAEEQMLLTSTFPYIETATGLGADAGTSIYKIPLGQSGLSTSTQRIAADRALALAKGLNQTTRNMAQQSIQTSLKLGESLNEAQDRLMSIIDDPVRAEMIARTESVDAYQSGLIDYGQQTGAETKEWQVAADPCDICSSLDGEVVDIGDSFSTGDYSPPAHPNCRCGMVLNYPDGTEDDSGDSGE